MALQDDGRCPCGTTTFAIDGPPPFRAFCHCTICQAYNGAPYAAELMRSLRRPARPDA